MLHLQRRRRVAVRGQEQPHVDSRARSVYQALLFLVRRDEVGGRDPDAALGIADRGEDRYVVARGQALGCAADDPDDFATRAVGWLIGRGIHCMVAGRRMVARPNRRGIVGPLQRRTVLLAPVFHEELFQLGDHWTGNLQIRVVPDVLDR